MRLYEDDFYATTCADSYIESHLREVEERERLGAAIVCESTPVSLPRIRGLCRDMREALDQLELHVYGDVERKRAGEEWVAYAAPPRTPDPRFQVMRLAVGGDEFVIRGGGP